MEPTLIENQDPSRPEHAEPTDAALSGWSKIIEPHRGWWDLRLGLLWRYRDLILIFVHRNFTASYSQTILGPLWFILQPLLTTVVFTVVFNKIAMIPTDKVPPFLFYMCGIVAWSYFAECITKTSITFSANAGLFEKVYFPRLAIPISIIITNLLAFSIQIAFFICFLLYFQLQGAPVHPNWLLLMVPFFVLVMAALGLGMGCIVSALTVKYRDLGKLVGFGVQLWMYGSCVAFPLSLVPEKWRWLIVWNPMVPVIEGFRLAFLGQSIVQPWHLAVGTGATLLILLLGLLLFNHVEKSVTDTI